MLNSEKEFCFFNNKESLSSKFINNLEKTQQETLLKNIILKDSYLLRFRNTLKISASSTILYLSFIICMFGMYFAVGLNKGSLLMFLISIFSLIGVTFCLFGVANILNKKECNLESRLKYEEYTEDIEYVVELFQKKFNVKVRYEFSNEFIPELYLFTNINEKEYRFFTFYGNSLKYSHPKEWFKRLEWSYEGLLNSIEEIKYKDLLYKIKKMDKDLWFSLGPNPDKALIKDSYDSLFSKATS